MFEKPANWDLNLLKNPKIYNVEDEETWRQKEIKRKCKVVDNLEGGDSDEGGKRWR